MGGEKVAKKYKIEWSNPVVISEFRGVKKTENPLVILSLEKMLKEEVKNFIDGELKKVDMRNFTQQDIRQWKKKVEDEVSALKRQTIVQKDGGIYYHKSEINMKDIQRIMTWVHKRSGKGTYHLFDGEKQLINKGQIIVPNNYRFVALENRVSTDYLLKSKLKKIRKDLALYFSDWEIEEVLWTLMLLKEKEITKMPKWLSERYGERIDYFQYFMKKDVTKLIMLSII